MTASILDLPQEVLFYIFSLVHGEISKNPFFRYHKKKDKLFVRKDERDRQWWRRNITARVLYGGTDVTYVDPSFTLSQKPCILPATISNLCMVSKDFNMVACGLWGSFYVEHFRKGEPYKRKHSPEFYRTKIYKVIRTYVESVVKNLEEEHTYCDTMKLIKNNNCSLYIETIQKSIDEGTIDNARFVYRINNLLQYRSYLAPGGPPYSSAGGPPAPPATVALDLRLNTVIQYRIKAKHELEMYTLKVIQLQESLLNRKKVLEMVQ